MGGNDSSDLDRALRRDLELLTKIAPLDIMG